MEWGIGDGSGSLASLWIINDTMVTHEIANYKLIPPTSR